MESLNPTKIAQVQLNSKNRPIFPPEFGRGFLSRNAGLITVGLAIAGRCRQWSLTLRGAATQMKTISVTG